jgi:hypothetical protein
MKLVYENIRGTGMDGASAMSGEFNGLKTLILADNSSAYYTHPCSPTAKGREIYANEYSKRQNQAP